MNDILWTDISYQMFPVLAHLALGDAETKKRERFNL